MMPIGVTPAVGTLVLLLRCPPFPHLRRALTSLTIMDFHKGIVAAVLSVALLGGGASAAQAQSKITKPKTWSGKAKGAAIGGAAGAATGAVVGGGKGALIGAAAGTVGGAVLGKKRDKKKDPVRYEQYSRKD